MISVLIPVRNEEHDIAECLASVRWCDDVWVYDSASSDRTAEIARSMAARIVPVPTGGGGYFGGDEAAHKNWSLRHIPFKHSWVLHIDADERVTPALAHNATAAVASPGQCVAFRVQRRDFFLGRWLKHVQASAFYVRLFRPDKLQYQRLINTMPVADGPIGQVEGYLDHFPFSKGLAHWIDRHNHYSTLEARQIVANRQLLNGFSMRAALLERDFHVRRSHQKELFYRLPARPLVKFLALYGAKGGFLDGRAGLAYSLLQSYYEYMIVLKTRELVEAEREAKAGVETCAR